MTADDRIITALDLPSIDEAEAMVARIGDACSFYKVGYQLLPLGGYALIERLSGEGKKTFLDAKLLDIGSTVEKGVRSISRLGADFLTVHADRDAVRGAAEGRGGDTRLKILAVTVLTSWDQAAVDAHGIAEPVEALVMRRAAMALEAGADGLVASGREAPLLRERFGDGLLIVTPGIRPTGADHGDQKRVLTPKEALGAGASHLVIGRPITGAGDPRAAAEAIAAEIASS
ncbi:MAG: orotidine-5'-phosphate decarboxylase [Parvularcula sp.]|jgi:orotidine-5'-phosphate decarboxylase|nr:orotidine-5'-phosphate decarboxylase [Parvularcula sp.]